MKFSIIIPSYNQAAFIEETILNAVEIKQRSAAHNIEIEILLFDSESDSDVRRVIEKHRNDIDVLEIKKDQGQYDAINKGITRCTGQYWTWLNTDDTLDIDGFLKMAQILRQDPAIDYIYGSVDYIDEKSRFMKRCDAYAIDFHTMITKEPAIFQQGSFFRKKFTDKIGLLKSFNCCFDYEYVLRCLKNGAKVHVCNFKVANFRQHAVSKTGSITPGFIRDQLVISKDYGRKWFHFLTWFSHLRLIKHKLFPRS
jgi:glycosyltransferase involved in cell wall biosynthesis